MPGPCFQENNVIIHGLLNHSNCMTVIELYIMSIIITIDHPIPNTHNSRNIQCRPQTLGALYHSIKLLNVKSGHSSTYSSTVPEPEPAPHYMCDCCAD